eukprot:6470357-Amphidinium_carterae.1
MSSLSSEGFYPKFCRITCTSNKNDVDQALGQERKPTIIKAKAQKQKGKSLRVQRVRALKTSNVEGLGLQRPEGNVGFGSWTCGFLRPTRISNFDGSGLQIYAIFIFSRPSPSFKILIKFSSFAFSPALLAFLGCKAEDLHIAYKLAARVLQRKDLREMPRPGATEYEQKEVRQKE